MGFFDFFAKKSAQSIAPSHWQPVVLEPFAGAWQHNQELKRTDLVNFHAIFACVSLIASDVGKLKITTKSLQDGVLLPTKSRCQKLFDRPNSYQSWQQFAENWISSKLLRGNTFVLKQRDIFGDIYRLVVLNPDRVRILLTDTGEVFYQISRDKLFDLDNDTIVPASEIIHDRYHCLYHPLVGLSPITACAMSVGVGLAIQSSSQTLFNNASTPSGVLSVPIALDADKANEIKRNWQQTYTGRNRGGVAVLGEGAKYESIAISSSDAQAIEQLKMTSEIVCSVFHVPAFKVGMGEIKAGMRVADLNEIYYSDCLQHYIEAMENLLDLHLELEAGIECVADLSSLIRMDSISQMAYLKEGTLSGIISPNEARASLGLAPVAGGESPLMQQQNYSLAALAKRDNSDDPFGSQTNSSTSIKEEDNDTGNA